MGGTRDLEGEESGGGGMEVSGEGGELGLLREDRGRRPTSEGSEGSLHGLAERRHRGGELIGGNSHLREKGYQTQTREKRNAEGEERRKEAGGGGGGKARLASNHHSHQNSSNTRPPMDSDLEAIRAVRTLPSAGLPALSHPLRRRNEWPSCRAAVAAVAAVAAAAAVRPPGSQPVRSLAEEGVEEATRKRLRSTPRRRRHGGRS